MSWTRRAARQARAPSAAGLLALAYAAYVCRCEVVSSWRKQRLDRARQQAAVRTRAAAPALVDGSSIGELEIRSAGGWPSRRARRFGEDSSPRGRTSARHGTARRTRKRRAGRSSRHVLPPAEGCSCRGCDHDEDARWRFRVSRGIDGRRAAERRQGAPAHWRTHLDADHMFSVFRARPGPRSLCRPGPRKGHWRRSLR